MCSEAYKEKKRGANRFYVLRGLQRKEKWGRQILCAQRLTEKKIKRVQTDSMCLRSIGVGADRFSVHGDPHYVAVDYVLSVL
jgi:hypothetical protein